MKKYELVIESYYFNNSDFKEYDNYIFESKNIESARAYAKNVISIFNNENKNVVYNLIDLCEVINND